MEGEAKNWPLAMQLPKLLSYPQCIRKAKPNSKERATSEASVNGRGQIHKWANGLIGAGWFTLQNASPDTSAFFFGFLCYCSWCHRHTQTSSKCCFWAQKPSLLGKHSATLLRCISQTQFGCSVLGSSYYSFSKRYKAALKKKKKNALGDISLAISSLKTHEPARPDFL